MPKIQTNNSKHQHQRQLGFTLLELLVVIGLLGLVAMSITGLMIEDQGVKRQEVTEKRWDEIRKAIIGDTSRTLNGEPMLSGYVADMGRLPRNLTELMVKDYDDDNDPLTPDFVQPAWAEFALYDPIAGCTPNPCTPLTLGAGWRGPYLYTGGSKYFKDGWSATETADLDFDWAVTLTGTSPAHSAIAVQSLGFDNAVGGTEYKADYPEAGINTVYASDWQLSTLPTPPTIQFTIHFNKAPLSSAQTALELRIYYFQDDANVTTSPADFIKNNEQVSNVLFDLPTTTPPVPVSTSITYSPPTAPTPPPYLPLGKYAALVWCTDDPATPTTEPDVIYDGNCDSEQDTDVKPYYFTMLPSATPTIKIYWNTQDTP
ncbi:MAG: prepilin-type N-terminal cleavage/methylation domain-containing protein [Methylotenera sp.]|nr:prepilin-type N-terminal cleavage/methylation domain-containing protein [Methylotenera sp.]